MYYRNIQKLRSQTQNRDDSSTESTHVPSLNTGIRSDSPLTESRIQLLDNENFIWDVAEYHWNIYLQKLRDFVELNGHALVPLSGVGSMALGRWCHKQRIEYAKLIRGEKTSMTDLRRDKLLQLGFHFKMEESVRAKQRKRTIKIQ
jgi:hypothetical protein